ncbi:MAG: malate dehydrogenase, partial [Nanoarchaeota archaeon]
MNKEEILEYHKGKKIGTVVEKEIKNQKDLSVIYTPGVAVPALEIEKNPELAYDYTNKKNSVAVITNGTAVLGLGDIGVLGAKPIMEGKCILFKKFGNVDAVDVLVDSKEPKEFIEVVKKISKTYGGINLEDIKAPECFEIEEELKKSLDIPVFHDDQHGSAIVAGAALLNALEINGKKIEEIKVVAVGAGAAGIACAKLF